LNFVLVCDLFGVKVQIFFCWFRNVSIQLTSTHIKMTAIFVCDSSGKIFGVRIPPESIGLFTFFLFFLQDYMFDIGLLNNLIFVLVDFPIIMINEYNGELMTLVLFFFLIFH